MHNLQLASTVSHLFAAFALAVALLGINWMGVFKVGVFFELVLFQRYARGRHFFKLLIAIAATAAIDVLALPFVSWFIGMFN